MVQSVRRAVGVTAAALGWLAALLEVLQSMDLTGEQPQVTLDPTTNQTAGQLYWTHEYLVDYWAYQRSQLSLNIVILIFTSLALLGLTYCVLCLKRVFRRYRRGVSDLPAFMLGCFLVGSVLPSVSLLQLTGINTSASVLSGSDGFPDDALQSLTISYNVSQGTIIFQFSALFLFVSLGILLAGFLSLRTGELPKSHAYMGIGTAIVGFITFLLELAAAQLNDQTSPVTTAFGVFLILYGVILLPIWTFWLAVLLPKLKLEDIANVGSEMSLSQNAEDKS